MRASWILLVLTLFGLTGWPLLAHAQQQERIVSYHSDIKINPDATMDVTETITVTVAGMGIKRGIYRDFPTKYRDQEGNSITVWFEPVEVRRNGSPEPYTLIDMSNGVRVRIGDPNVYLDYGEHTYTIMYRTSRQLGFFREHDELYWNVTGNGWDFPMDSASARIELPSDVQASDIRLMAYTGAYGSHSTAYRAEVLAPGVAEFQSTAPLGRYEGMTIVVQWPKGVVTEPSPSQKAGYWLITNLLVVAVPLGLLAIFVFYWLTWRRVGVDPPAGFIVPELSPPKGLSPASLYYIRHMSAGNKAFVAALLSMAEKGYLAIGEDESGDYTLTRTSQESRELAPEEEALASRLFADGNVLLVDQDNHSTFGGAQTAMRKSLAKQHDNVYFVRNSQEGCFGVTFSAAVVVVIVLLKFLPHVEWGGMLAPLIIGAIAINAVFLIIMPRPTALGRMLLDKLEGFKLALAGGMDDLGDEHYRDKILIAENLPYAVALEVHHSWAKRFEQALVARRKEAGEAVSSSQMYWPAWYHFAGGSSGSRNLNFSRFTNDLTSSFTSSISSASTAPGSSSGSSGGMSGGGGGGGGGGGW